MAKSNPTQRLLNRVIDRADSMIYFVDDDELLLFANPTLAAWVGLDLVQLKGLRTWFTSQPVDDPAAEKIQGLCPPPELWGGHREGGEAVVTKSFWISRSLDSGRQAEFCWATGVRIDSNTASGVLVIADPTTSLIQESGQTPILSQIESDQLHSTLARIALELRRGYRVDSLVGVSPFSSRIRRQVEIATQTDSDILVHGPLGCGKERLARTIFSIASQRQLEQVGGRELAPVHCAIADPPLIQQRIADARASTAADERIVLLLLDVDLLSTDAQAELLGFLELPGFKIQTLATASTPLVDLATGGKFSKRLAHRLGPLTIEMVPLTARVEDIPLLAQSILESGNVRRSRQLEGFSNVALERLMEFNWPENMNQLASVIEAAAANCSGRQIQQDDLPLEFHQALQAMRIGKRVEVSIDLDEYLAAIEKQLILRALKQTRGNKTQAAKQLGISRPKLLRRLSYLKLDEYLSPSTTRPSAANSKPLTSTAQSSTEDTSEARDHDQLDSSAFEELSE